MVTSVVEERATRKVVPKAGAKEEVSQSLQVARLVPVRGAQFALVIMIKRSAVGTPIARLLTSAGFAFRSTLFMHAGETLDRPPQFLRRRREAGGID